MEVVLAEDRGSSAGTAAAGNGGGTVRMMRLPGIIDRLRGLDPWLADALIALALVLLIELQFILGDQPGTEADAVNLIGGLLLGGSLAWRRRAPLAMIGVFVAAIIANEALGGGLFSFPGPGSHGEIPPFGSLVTGAIAFYSLGAHAADGHTRVGLAIGLVGLWTTVIISGQVDFGSFFFSTALGAT